MADISPAYILARVHFSQIMRHSLITLLFVLFFSCRSMFSWLPPVFIFMTGCATGMRPLTELRCVCLTMTGRESQAACGWALTPGGEERLCIATQLAFQLFGGLIRGLEERALWVSGLIKFISDELEWLTGGRSGRKFLFRKIFLDVLLIYSSLLFTSQFAASLCNYSLGILSFSCVKTPTLGGSLEKASINLYFSYTSSLFRRILPNWPHSIFSLFFFLTQAFNNSCAPYSVYKKCFISVHFINWCTPVINISVL